MACKNALDTQFGTLLNQSQPYPYLINHSHHENADRHDDDRVNHEIDQRDDERKTAAENRHGAVEKHDADGHDQ